MLLRKNVVSSIDQNQKKNSLNFLRQAHQLANSGIAIIAYDSAPLVNNVPTRQVASKIRSFIIKSLVSFHSIFVVWHSSLSTGACVHFGIISSRSICMEKCTSGATYISDRCADNRSIPGRYGVILDAGSSVRMGCARRRSTILIPDVRVPELIYTDGFIIT